MNKLKKNLLKVGAFLAATVMVGGWFVSPIDAGNGRDCDSNAVIRCGTLTTGELSNALAHGASGPHQTAYALTSLFHRFGLDRSDIGHLKNGRVTKSGLVYVGNRVVARNVHSMGRHYMPGSRRVSGVSYPLYIRHPSVSFRQSSLDAFVLMNSDGSMAMAVLKSCGNIIPGVGKRLPQPGYFIKIRKFIDTNGNGIRDAGELPHGGVTFTIVGPGTRKTVKTDRNGYVRVDHLKRGVYTITEKVPSGYRATTPNPRRIWHTKNQDFYFGNQRIPQPQEGQLEVVKFRDSNANKTRDEEEELLSGWQFNVTGPNGFAQTITTGEDGIARLTGLVPGRYTVTEVLQAGWENTTGLTANADVVDGRIATLIFGNRQPEAPPPPPEGGEEVTPTELPVSGPLDGIATVFASMSLAGTGLTWLKSKKSLLAAFRK